MCLDMFFSMICTFFFVFWKGSVSSWKRKSFRSFVQIFLILLVTYCATVDRNEPGMGCGLGHVLQKDLYLAVSSLGRWEMCSSPKPVIRNFFVLAHCLVSVTPVKTNKIQKNQSRLNTRSLIRRLLMSFKFLTTKAVPIGWFKLQGQIDVFKQETTLFVGVLWSMVCVHMKGIVATRHKAEFFHISMKCFSFIHVFFCKWHLKLAA